MEIEYIFYFFLITCRILTPQVKSHTYIHSKNKIVKLFSYIRESKVKNTKKYSILITLELQTFTFNFARC